MRLINLMLEGGSIRVGKPVNSRHSETNLLHDGKNPRLRVVVAISSDDQIDLLVRGVLAISLGEAEEGILRGRGHDGGGKDGGAGRTHDVRGDRGKTGFRGGNERRRRRGSGSGHDGRFYLRAV